ncbi:phage tail assembly protein [Novosphingobium clariflavum]|uniref:Phage tail assembly protein n=1 Tax=Novosphingobium clariflavum TaxID=2029884 RepID=A0ABV6S2V7_9SPHN|nr:phage tail assembly protein [Novosphingobium clariflavum]
MAEQPEISAVTAPKNHFERVVLVEPIVRGPRTIESLNIRKPKAGELRGTSMQDILTTDVAAMLRLIPRVSEPSLTPEEADNLTSEDFAELAGVIRGFFITKMERMAVDAMLAEHSPKT